MDPEGWERGSKCLHLEAHRKKQPERDVNVHMKPGLFPWTVA